MYLTFILFILLVAFNLCQLFNLNRLEHTRVSRDDVLAIRGRRHGSILFDMGVARSRSLFSFGELYLCALGLGRIPDGFVCLFRSVYFFISSFSWTADLLVSPISWSFGRLSGTSGSLVIIGRPHRAV